MWNDEVLVWEQTIDHPWDKFGIQSDVPIPADDNMLASPVIFYKQQRLDVIVKKVSDTIMAGIGTYEDPSVATSFVLAFSALSLFPLHVKVIRDDDLAVEFVKKLHQENGQEFFYKDEVLINSDIEAIVNHLIETGLLVAKDERLILQGKILNKAHILGK